MMRISWCLLICGCLWLGLIAAQAQPPMSSPWNDHPSHRWLPPPKDKNSIADQIGMLERLSQLAGGGQTDQPPTPQLTPEQMQMLDSVVESFRNDKGELELPNLDSVPKSWIDSLLPDPKQRQQAKRLLEEYARERKLPLPGSDPNLPTAPTRQPYNQLDSNPFGNAQADNPDNNRLRPNQSGANQSRNDQPGAGQPGNSPLGSNQPNNRGRTGVNPPGARTPADSSAAEKPSSDRTLNGGPFDNQPRSPSTMPKEVMDLIERLKQVDRAQQQQQSDRASQAATGPRGSSSSRASGNSNTRSPARNTPSTRAGSNNSNNNNRSGLRDPQTNTNNPNNWRPTRPPIPQPNPSGLPNQFPNPNLFNPNQNVDPNADAPITNPFDPSTSPSPTDAQNANELLFDNSLSAPVQNNAIGQPNEVPARNQPQEPLRSAAPRSAPKPFRATELSKQPAATPAATEQPFDVEKSLAQSGMARTLRRIVEKTLKEENAKASTGRQGSEVGNAGGLNSPGSDKANPGAGQSASNSSWWSEALKSWQKPDNGATTNSSAANGSGRNGPFSPTSQEPTSTSAAANAVSNSISSVSRSLRSNQSGEWGRFMNDIWKSVSEAPARSSGTTVGSSSGMTGARTLMPSFTWNGNMTLVVSMTLLLVAGLLWLGRKRLIELAVPVDRQTQWARNVLAEGLKTRADVVRAFHHLVLQTRPIANWWNHRYVAQQFGSHSPQLAAAMDELTLVYEQARYYPPDQQLSDQQLERVHTLLKSMAEK